MARRIIEKAAERAARAAGIGPKPSNNGRSRGGADDYPPEQRGDAWEPPRQGEERGGFGSHLDAPPKPEAPQVETFSAADLMSMEIPPMRWAVDGVLPEGVTILGGKPKLGKSWLALHLALAISSGGIALGRIDVERGDVLYLALEDTKRRLQSRIRRLLGATESPSPRLTLATKWPRMDKGGLDVIVAWAQERRQARAVIIDTWAKFKPVRLGRSDSYEIDYADGSCIKEVSDSLRLPFQVLHHCRKLGSTDPLEEISGSVGLTGACDGALVMRRERGQLDASLLVSGRDVEETELALVFDKDHCLWQLVGDAEDFRLSKERTRILDLFRDDDAELSPKQMEALTGRPGNAIRRLVAKMARDGQLTVTDRGRYRRAPEDAGGTNPFIPDED